MYPYHNKIKQRIRNGELTGWYITDYYPNIGAAIVLEFSTTPQKRPIRPYRWIEYIPILAEETANKILQKLSELEETE